jgi:hypothetical protein
MAANQQMLGAVSGMASDLAGGLTGSTGNQLGGLLQG